MHHVIHFIEGVVLFGGAIGVVADETVRFAVRRIRKIGKHS